MSFKSTSLHALTSFILLACGGQGGEGQIAGQTSTGGSTANPVCANSCFENCITCEGKTGRECSVECASGTGGTSGGTGGTASTGTGGTASTGTGGTASTGTGGTTSTGTGGTGAGGATTTTQSFTFTMDSFTVAAGSEAYICQDYVNPFGKDVDFLVSESFMTSGSHHMFLFRTTQATANTSTFPCPSGGSEFHEFVHTAQSPHLLVSYPPGVGRYAPASQNFRMMVHYLNTGATDITPTVSVRADYVDPSQVTAHAAGIFLNWMGLSVPPGPSAITHNFTMPNYDFGILGGASHMHMRGVGFNATTSTGGVIYNIPNPTAGAWNEPPANVFTPALPVTANSNITVECDYDNTTQNTYTFGDSAVNNEMCIYAGAYYPAPGGTSIVQQCLSGGLCVSTLN